MTSQHRGVVAQPTVALDQHKRPQAGPITVLPRGSAGIEDVVRRAGGQVADLSDETRGLIWMSYTGPDELRVLLDAHPKISWVQLPLAGVDAYASALKSVGSVDFPLWTSAKGAYSQPVAEHALVLTLALLRLIPQRVRATSWATGTKEGTSLFGLSVVIIGAGGIAIELMRLLEPFGVRVTVVRRSEGDVSGADSTVTSDRLAEVIPDADVLVVAAAFTDGTRHLIGQRELSAMKPTAILVNIARGGLVDTEALTGALAAKTIAGAGIDVTDPEPLPDGHPLWDEPNVIITPHSADTPAMIQPLLEERIRENVAAFLGDGRFVGVVDLEAGY